MSSTDAEGFWPGTSDARSVLRARAATTPAERLAWLEESLLLAQASGALARDRARRQRWADAWSYAVVHRMDNQGAPHRPDTLTR